MILRVLLTTGVMLFFSGIGQAASIGDLLGLSDQLITEKNSSILGGSLQNVDDSPVSSSAGTSCGAPSYSSCREVPVCGGAQPAPKFGSSCRSGNGLPLNLTINITININVNVNCAATQPPASRSGCF